MIFEASCFRAVMMSFLHFFDLPLTQPLFEVA